MELREALSQISEIRLHIARTEVFRGYRALPIASSGIIAFLASGIQAIWISDPSKAIESYVGLWLVTAGLAAAVSGTGMLYRCVVSDSQMVREATWLAIEQFIPCLLAGSLLTVTLLLFAPEGLWTLPGLWAMLFGMGIFASHRLLPRMTFWVAMYYLVSGAAVLALARGHFAFAPWAMAIPFGVGQLLAAAVLYWTLERTDVETT